MNNNKRKYGWIPDIPDNRDFLYSRVMKVPKTLPVKVDLRKKCSSIEDQGQLGSCTANALVGNLEFLDVRDGNGYIDQSRLFIYYNERLLRDTVNEDSGAMLRDGIKSLVKWGSCSETTWPYKINNFTKKPSLKTYQSAKKHCITSYHRMNTIDEMKVCLADGFPFVFGFAVYESFQTQEVVRTGIANLPDGKEHMLGGHAVVSVGYDEKLKRFIVRNSWGIEWGIKGYFTMPYQYLESRDLSDDFWTIRK
ncbi:MAG: C1 family peptidase [Elusimicrobia bacterium]|nr:C1 family peptidase [Elusimicrobiota bacterium]